MADDRAGTPSVRVRFEIPRAELDRAEQALQEAGPAIEAVSHDLRFDETHLRGRVLFDLGVPFAADPMLDFLKEKRGLRAEPPLTVALEQPVAYLVGQLASALVLSLRGEGDFTIPLSGGRGAVSVAARAGASDLALPLDQYAGVASVPSADLARATAAACGALEEILRSRPALARWSFLEFLRREARILSAGPPRAAASPAEGTELGRAPYRWSAAHFGRGGSRDLAALATEAERDGAHVVPYWRVTRFGNEGALHFDPARAAGKPERRGALALCIFPGFDTTIEVEIQGDKKGTQRLRERLKRNAPFRASLGQGALAGIQEASDALPMA